MDAILVRCGETCVGEISTRQTHHTRGCGLDSAVKASVGEVSTRQTCHTRGCGLDGKTICKSSRCGCLPARGLLDIPPCPGATEPRGSRASGQLRWLGEDFCRDHWSMGESNTNGSGQAGAAMVLCCAARCRWFRIEANFSTHWGVRRTQGRHLTEG